MCTYIVQNKTQHLQSCCNWPLHTYIHTLTHEQNATLNTSTRLLYTCTVTKINFLISLSILWRRPRGRIPRSSFICAWSSESRHSPSTSLLEKHWTNSSRCTSFSHCATSCVDQELTLWGLRIPLRPAVCRGGDGRA